MANVKALGDLIREAHLSVPIDAPRQVQDAWIDAGKAMRDKVLRIIEQAGVGAVPIEMPETVSG